MLLSNLLLLITELVVKRTIFTARNVVSTSDQYGFVVQLSDICHVNHWYVLTIFLLQ